MAQTDDLPAGAQTNSDDRPKAPTGAASTAAVSAESCMVCGKDLSGMSMLTRQLHVNDCLDKPATEQLVAALRVAERCNTSESSSSSSSSISVSCPVCDRNLDHLTEIRQQQHINRCCDGTEKSAKESKMKKARKTGKKRDGEPPRRDGGSSEGWESRMSGPPAGYVPLV